MALVLGLCFLGFQTWTQWNLANAAGVAIFPTGLAPLQQLTAPSTADKLASQSAQAQVAGDHEKALQLANEAIKADSKEPWGHYTRGDALGSLHRVDDAVEAFRQAEQRFSPADSWGRSVAIWAQANAFMQVGRFQEASATFERYIAFLERVDKDAAMLARRYEEYCASASKPH
jgi:tetratricopeptide (TPR) repeat protein